MSDRREFLTSLAAAPVVGLLPYYPSSANLADEPLVPLPPPIVPEIEEPPLFFYVSTDSSNPKLLDEIATSTIEIEHDRKTDKKYGGTRKKKRYKRVRFVPLDREERFALAEVRWCTPHPDWRIHEHGTPESEAEWKVYFERQDCFPPPRSLVAVPGALEPHYSEWFKDSFPITREAALEWVAELNEKSIADGLVKNGRALAIDWCIVTELGRHIERACLDIDFDSNGFGVLNRTRQWPMRVVRPTAEEMDRFPVTAELLAKGGVA